MSIKLPPTITNQQLKVLELSAKGLTNKQIAELLFISVSTVKRHRQDIMMQVGIKGKLAMRVFLRSFIEG
jgi:DNA-binding NarL/FixJ family response regulator